MYIHVNNPQPRIKKTSDNDAPETENDAYKDNTSAHTYTAPHAGTAGAAGTADTVSELDNNPNQNGALPQRPLKLH